MPGFSGWQQRCQPNNVNHHWQNGGNQMVGGPITNGQNRHQGNQMAGGQRIRMTICGRCNVHYRFGTRHQCNGIQQGNERNGGLNRQLADDPNYSIRRSPW